MSEIEDQIKSLRAWNGDGQYPQCEGAADTIESLLTEVSELAVTLKDIAEYSVLDPDGLSGADAYAMQDAARAAVSGSLDD
jgi:hypothetical protein